MFITCPNKHTPIKVTDLPKAIEDAFEYSLYEYEDKEYGTEERKSYWTNIYNQLQNISKEKTYIHNEQDVVLNYDVIYKFKIKDSLAWCYWELKVGKCKNNLWGYGYWTPGVVSPCCTGLFDSKEEAEKEAFNFLKNWFKKGFTENQGYNKTIFSKGKKDFHLFLNKRLNDLPSQTSHLVSVLNTGANYIQTSLF